MSLDVSLPLPPPNPAPSSAWARLAFDLSAAGVSVADEGVVRAYLERHAGLCDAVALVGRAARDEFGPDASLRLELAQDRVSAEQALVLRLRLPDYPAGTMRRVRDLTDEYEHSTWDEEGVIFVTTDFVPTR